MKKYVKKIIRFFKKHSIVTYVGISLLVVLFVPKYFAPAWLSSWIFYFYLYAIVSLALLHEMIKAVYFLIKKDKKRLYAIFSPGRKPGKALVIFYFLTFFFGIFLLFALLPTIKNTVVSLVHEDVSIKRIHTVERYSHIGVNSLGSYLTIADKEEGLYTFFFLHPYRHKEGQRYFFHYLPSFFGIGAILDFYPVDERGNMIPW